MEAAGAGSRAVYTRPVLETFGAFTAITRRVHTSGRWDGAFSGKTRT